MHAGRNVRYPFLPSYFYENWNVPIDFSKIHKYQIPLNPFRDSELRTDGQIDMAKLTGEFYNFSLRT